VSTTKDNKKATRIINILYAAVAAAVFFVLPTVYFIEDYFSEKHEIEVWANFQAPIIKRIIKRNPEIWPHEITPLLTRLEQELPNDDDDETRHSLLDQDRNILFTFPSNAISRPVVAEEVALHHAGRILGYYRVERSLRGALFEALMVALGALLLAFIIAVPLRKLSLRALHDAFEELEREKDKALITLLSIGDAVITTDARMHVKSLNPVAEKLTGWTASDANDVHVGTVLQIFLATAPEVKIDSLASLLTSAAFHPDKSQAILTRRTDNKEIYIEYGIAPIVQKDGCIIGSVIVFHDVTERRRAEELLRSSELRANSALSIARLGTFEWDMKTDRVQCSPRTREIFGFAEDEGKVASEYFNRILPEDRERVQQDIKAALNKPDKSSRSEFRLTLPNGKIRHVICLGTFEKDLNGELRSQVGVFSDVTDYKNNEEKLKDADRRKDEFLAMLGHELRNPLAPVSAAADLLQTTKPDDATVREVSEVVRRQVNHIVGLVDDLLDVSRITKGMIAIEKKPIDLNFIVKLALEQVSPLIHSRHHHIELHLSAGDTFVEGDEKRLIQVFANLLNNSAKYTPDGGHILVKTELLESRVLASVHDNGVGITAESVHSVFELFVQEKRTPDRSSGGLGLGLPLVKSIVELHGGSVTCSSKGIGKGSTFSVSLPRALKQDKTEAQPLSLASPQAKLASKRKVLVVDDNREAARMLVLLLSALGHEVLVEHDSLQALQRARSEVPDVCLLDIGLPHMNGIELACQLRAQPETASTLLIAVSGYGQEQDKRDAMAAGFDHYLTKPLSASELTLLLADLTREPA
jgi:PAS domain S-box-containing protein